MQISNLAIKNSFQVTCRICSNHTSTHTNTIVSHRSPGCRFPGTGMDLRRQRISKLSENALPEITTDVGLPHLDHSVARDQETGLCGLGLLLNPKHFALVPDRVCALVPDTLSSKAL